MNGPAAATEKLYYADPYRKEFDARIVRLEEQDGQFLVVLDRTCFYPEGGGQPADHGWIGDLQVTDVHEKDGLIVHSCIDIRDSHFRRQVGVREQSLIADTAGLARKGGLNAAKAAGQIVQCKLDWSRRFDHMQQHSGEHIVSGMLCETFHCNNVGFHMGEDFVTIDYDAPMTEQDIRKIEDRANRYIQENHPFEELWPTPEELESIPYRSKKALEGAVRITRFPGADCCACCGTHVRTSAEIGFVKLFSVTKFREGVRIEMMSGLRLFRYLSACHDQNILCSQVTSSKPLETGAAVLQMKEEVIRLKGRIAGLENETFGYIAGELADTDSPVYFTGELSSDALRKLCVKIAARAKGRVMVFAGSGDAYSYAVIEEGADLVPFVRLLNEALNGRGGGRDGYAQGSLHATEEEIRSFLKNADQ